SFTLGASGAVVSVTFPFPDSDLLPDISVSVAVISLPTFNSVPVSYTHLKKKKNFNYDAALERTWYTRVAVVAGRQDFV
ncbi:hypothetical protein MU469_14205, partial [Staphylococcus aureus]|uniref:hypothetical protein n=1 Tax=Staphylococcus aureus TaxID=1280 RepID=UPI001FD145F6